jgi:hypothetical protein
MDDLTITPGMDGDEKIRRTNAIVDRELLPALERYYGRILTDNEKRTVYGHVNMLFMDPCPLWELNEHDNKFADRMLSRMGLNRRRN